VRRSAELRGLSDDHHRALVLAKLAKTAATTQEGDEVGALWHAIKREWETGLARHFAIEEAYLLPPVRMAGGEALASRVEQDHTAIRDHVLSGPFDEIGLRQFAERLSDHVRFEERELFPFAEAKLTQSDLDRIASAHRG
jgi:hemerythrin-like domain-containing protein